MGTTRRVRVKASGSRKIVDQPKLGAHWGDTVEILVGEKGSVYFPRSEEALVNKSPVRKTASGTVILRIKATRPTRRHRVPDSSEYPYSIYCAESNKMAETNERGSAPIIIINGSPAKKGARKP